MNPNSPSNVTIILTATVNVNPHIYDSLRRNTGIREKEYIDACKYYSAFPFVKKVILVENSNWKFKEDLPEKTQLVSLSTTDFSPDLYKHITNIKTLGDWTCICKGLDVISDPEEFVIKITGRLKIQGFTDLIDNLDFNKINVAQYFKSQAWVSSWFIAGRCCAMKEIFQDMYKPLLDTHFLEALKWLEAPENITVNCLEKELYKKLKFNDLNIIKGDYAVNEKPCTKCLFHFPYYRFDGYVENFMNRHLKANKPTNIPNHKNSLSITDILNPLKINLPASSVQRAPIRGNKTTTNKDVIKFLRKASEMKPEDLPVYDGTTIPKIIHFCYINYKQIPDTHDDIFSAWMKYLPDYTFINWTPDKIKENIFTKTALKNKKWAFFADYARVYAVSTYGGFYLDCDVMVYKSFNELLNLPYVFDTERHPVDNNTKLTIECGSFGARPDNKLLNAVKTHYENLKEVTYNGDLVAPVLWNHIAEDNNIIINYDSAEKCRYKEKDLYDENLNIGVYKNKVESDPNIIYTLDSTYLSKPNRDIMTYYHSAYYHDEHGVFPWAYTSHQFYTEWSFDRPSKNM